MTKKISADDIRKSVAEEDVRFIRLAFTDINGTLKAVEVPNSQLDKVLSNDVRFDGSSIDGFVRLEESDMILYPDFSTWSVLPWDDSAGGKIGCLTCSVHTTDGKPFAGDPRNNLKRIIGQMKEMGFTAFDIGFEAEFHLLKLDQNGNWTTEVPDHASYFDLTSNDESASCRRDIVETLESIGFEVEAAHHEVGDGQQEIDFRFDDALTTADRVQTFKMIVREIAKRHGLFATFMAKPLQGQAGNGMHTNMSLFKGNQNAFYDENNEYHLSKTALYFLNGILEHARAITAVGNPTVNSYKRLIPGFEAPVYISWASKNRSPMVRVPAAGELNTRLEMRSADPTANPYLLLAACLSAGMAGIKEEKMPMEPITCNLFTLSEKQRNEMGIKPLPSTLHNALKAFKKDKLIQDALGEHLTQSFIYSKELEWSQYTQTVSDWERNRYMGY
ncbi:MULTISPECIES: type I glutamate--ammonia ligase [unclassified Lactobacillus]|uniref:type I glutamate--ammonia ligase n=1 Tax=unclassified Lactobacillus TaxID=2620435 RepID=UPI0018DC86FD|nr:MULTISPECIES: type I glutamate--ammonia ligase [unclassified Lactobacillus]MBH9989549.1 type I glutamate--ammonia ligase [Lactobacillus sp. M0392]MBI0023252.1 type I glutamate--ammonia ligase [Lactobacillus sp. W8171]MBI0044628.1 type I glutamate--ammonia ligase [Lactobacillus sp. M0393]